MNKVAFIGAASLMVGCMAVNARDDVRINPYALFNRNKMTKGDNPPIGILMCTGVGKETAEYLAPFIDQ